MKSCSTCKEHQALTEFARDKRNNDGLSGSCRSCQRLSSKKYYQANLVKSRAIRKEYQKENPDKSNLSSKKWKEENPQKVIEMNKKWTSLNLDKVNAKGSKYRASKLNATPSWLTEDHIKQIEQFYSSAKALEHDNGIKYHVDHIIPLQGKEVCGLHVPWNLQILSAEENKSKSNRLL
jgi:5-methylcytosine-specific restriction endonuclease McrA